VLSTERIEDDPMNKHLPEITPEERADLFHQAKQIAKTWAALGRDCDDQNRFPTETIEPYKQSPITAMSVPRKFGGLGADILTASQVGRELAKGDPAIALSYNMHQAMVGIFRGTPALDERTRADVLTRVAEERVIICGPFSEARAGLSGLADTVAVPVPSGGWRITGKKNWSTLVLGSDLTALNATITDADGTVPEGFRQRAERESLFIIPTDSPNLTIDRTWDTMGMRATGSHTIVLDGVPAAPGTYCGNFRQGLIGEAEWAAMLFAGVYLGLADKALEETTEILKEKHLGATATGQDTDVKQLGYVQFELGRMRIELDTAARVLEATGQIAIDGRYEEWPESVRKAKWDLAKVVATEAAMSVTDRAFRLVGGSAFRRGHVLERLFRDGRAGYLHSFTTNQLYDFMGRFELGLIG
jgi:alkylation response protein AidB-like acyl-CoA dehydrogenase